MKLNCDMKPICETALKSLLWAPTCVLGLKLMRTCYDWPVKNQPFIFNLPLKIKGNSKHTSGNSLCPLEPRKGYRCCFTDVTNQS